MNSFKRRKLGRSDQEVKPWCWLLGQDEKRICLILGLMSLLGSSRHVPFEQCRQELPLVSRYWRRLLREPEVWDGRVSFTFSGLKVQSLLIFSPDGQLCRLGFVQQPEVRDNSNRMTSWEGAWEGRHRVDIKTPSRGGQRWCMPWLEASLQGHKHPGIWHPFDGELLGADMTVRCFRHTGFSWLWCSVSAAEVIAGTGQGDIGADSGVSRSLLMEIRSRPL